MKVTKDLTEGNIYKNFLLYALPILASTLLSNAYSTVDAMIAGKFISDTALGAISSTHSYEVVFFSFFNGFAAGFSIYIANLFGKRDNARIKKDMINVIELVSAVILLISAVSIALRAPILDYLKVDEILREDAETYFIIYTAGYIFSIMNVFLSISLCALGVTSYSLYISLGSALVNLGGNIFTIVVLGMGVDGVAVSTLLSSLSGLICYLFILRRAFAELQSEPVSYRFSFSGVANSLKYTIPAAIQQVAFHGVGFLIAPIINGLGAAATTANTVATKIYSIAATSLWTMARPLTCYVAQSTGKGNYGEIKRGLRVGIFLGCMMLLPFVIVMALFARPITALFFPADYVGEAFDYALRFPSFYMPFLYINLVGHFLHSYIRSLGKVNVVLLITLFGSLARFLSTLILVKYFYIEGIYIGQVISWIADGLLSVVLYYAFFSGEDSVRRVIENDKKKKRVL